MSTNIREQIDNRFTDEQRQRQSNLSERTREQRDDLLECIHQLEAAMGSPAPGREREWSARASRDLKVVRESLERHVLSAEGSNGLFQELDLACIPSAQLITTDLRREHSLILDQVRRLEKALSAQDQPADFVALRQEAEQVLSLIRRHNANEVDLIFKCFWLDIGVGD
jgi:hypothetical protein